MSGLHAAAVRTDVTPPPGGPLAGYGARGDAVAQGAHDPLEATLVWLHDDASDRDVVWIGLDVVGADEEISGAVAAAVAAAIGRPEAVVLVCASHTHSSAAAWFHRPTAGFEVIGSAAPEESEAARHVLVDRIAAAAGRLPGSLRPVRVVATEAGVHGVGANRHRIDGPHDPTAGVLATLDEHGCVHAVVTDYGSHPTVLGHDNLLWSADWPGAARRALSGALTGLTAFPGTDGGEPATRAPVVLFLQGAAGDSSARFVRRQQTFDEADRLGGRYAGQVLDALLEAAVDEVPGRLSVGRTTVTLPTKRTLAPEAALEREEQARSAWEEVRRTHPDGSPAERLARTRYEGALVDRRLIEAELPPTLTLSLTVVALGGRAWVHLPVELFASFALRIRAASPFPATRVVGYTDGYLGYIADADAHRDGVYEAGVSLFDIDASEQLCEAAIALLRETAQRRTPAAPEVAR
jgi:hypothetical protein